LNWHVVDVFIGLATAVVKAGVKIWLKDDAFAADVSVSVADLVSGKVSGDLEQRKIRRFFEDLEVPFAAYDLASGSVIAQHYRIRQWINEWNKNPRPFSWTKSAGEILETIAEYCQRLTSPGTLAR
jgi:hypothetical protein